MTTSDNYPHPLEVEPDNTSGEDTGHNYRYQHAFGVILLIEASCNKRPYVALYAEHHEDILCERLDKKFDGYQIKTRKPEKGEWDLNDDDVKSSIKRFVQLNKAFGDHFCTLNFVSNVSYSNPGVTIQDQTKLRRSPLRFKDAIRKCSCVEEVAKPYDQTIQDLAKHCGCTPEELFATLQKVEFVNGPDRDSIASKITDIHLPQIDECAKYPIPVVNGIREALIHRVAFAASEVEDPSKHLYPIGTLSFENPHITAKRVPVGVVNQIIHDKLHPSFRYSGVQGINLGNGKGNLWRLQKKMKRGFLHYQVETMENRSISAEEQLIELAHQKPGEIETYLIQLTGVVRAECDEAYHYASLTDKPIGPQMLADVFRRLKIKADQQRDMVYRQPYELLVGIAGLLTGECKIWWSEPFDLDGPE